MTKKLIGYVIRNRIVSYTGLKVYQTRKIAERYANGVEVLEAYVDLP
jgi:hypothetical protein